MVGVEGIDDFRGFEEVVVIVVVVVVVIVEDCWVVEGVWLIGVVFGLLFLFLKKKNYMLYLMIFN